jgi:hypothetical protein
MTLPTPATETDTGPRMPGRERLCAATREVRPVAELIRFVAGPQGLVPDLKRKLPGRGVWITARRDTVADAVRRGTFRKSLKSDIAVPSDLPAMVERLMLRAALGALSIAHKAGEVVAGTGKVEDAIAGDRAAAILHATDAAPDGVRKLDTALRRRFPDDGGGKNGRKVPVIRAFTSAELDLALGRSNVVHAALLAGRAGETFLMRWHDLWHFRMPEKDPDYREDDAGVSSAAAPKLEME